MIRKAFIDAAVTAILASKDVVKNDHTTLAKAAGTATERILTITVNTLRHSREARASFLPRLSLILHNTATGIEMTKWFLAKIIHAQIGRLTQDVCENI